MLYELQEALMARFNSVDGAALRALVQGLWEDVAPSSVVSGTQDGEELKASTLPWMTFSTITTGLQQDTCSNRFEPMVQFTIFGDGNNKSSSDLLEIGTEFLELYGDGLLSMDNDYEMIRNDTIDQRKFKDNDNIFNIIYVLQFTIEKDR